MRLLDLFCGGGLAAQGYWSSGMFTDIAGVDINDMAASYPFNFIQGDAINLDYEFLQSFDLIHASPPCQAYSNLTPTQLKIAKPRLIAATRLMLHSSGIPYIIENVQGAIKDLEPNVVMNGLYFGLPLNRKRFFNVSTLDTGFRFISSGAAVNVHGSEYIDRSTLLECFGLNAGYLSTRWVSNLNIRHIEEGIPPVFTKHLAEMLVAAKAFIS